MAALATNENSASVSGALARAILVVRLFCVEVHRSARRHGVADEDIDHAYRQSVTWVELGDDPPRYLVVVPTGPAIFLSWS